MALSVLPNGLRDDFKTEYEWADVTTSVFIHGNVRSMSTPDWDRREIYMVSTCDRSSFGVRVFVF